jgi:2-dehydro-3-deoxygalactonokinase
MSKSFKLCLDVGITQTRVWLLKEREIVARASILQGIREGAEAATASIERAIQQCLQNAGLSGPIQVDYIAAAGMVTSELGPYALPHLRGASSTTRFADNIEERRYSGCVEAPLFLIRGLRFGDDSHPDERDAMRGEEALFVGLLARGVLENGQSLLNLGSHWKLILSNSKGEIEASYTGIGGELALAISRETILKSALPEARPTRLDTEHLDRGRARSMEYGLGRALFLLRMDTQNETISQAQAYWQMLGAIIGDALPFLTQRAQRTAGGHVAIAGYPALAQAWARALDCQQVTSRLLTDAEVEQSFCAGLVHIVERRQAASDNYSYKKHPLRESFGQSIE